MKWYYQKYKGFLLIETMMSLVLMAFMSLTYYKSFIQLKRIQQDYHDTIVVSELKLNIETRYLFHECMPTQYDRYGYFQRPYYYELLIEEKDFVLVRIQDQMEIQRWAIV
jgi:hypothetical protein